ncbi:glycine--tRNA ligase subunit beta [Acidithiobacillus sp.]|uniref:glycine--tRNA ligase subunit beta n=1 Tax=Acidithiobacillus sp. TaxID=1872118 RepID=UPI003D0889A9
MSEYDDFLLELGCEELPAREQLPLQAAAMEILPRLLDEAGLDQGSVHAFVTPRRLALRVERLARHSRPREILRRGPAVDRAYDADGTPSRAAVGFARSCGVEMQDLITLDTDKGAFLAWRQVEAPQSAKTLLPGIIHEFLRSLPLRKRMRWGDREENFLRPVRWLLLRHGDEVIPFRAFGLEAQGTSYGHRVHHPGAVAIARPSNYAKDLEAAFVMADFAERRAAIAQKAASLAADMEATVILPSGLLEEITGLNEWPVILAGAFATEYLAIPEEVLITVMMQHQRYIPLRGPTGRLIQHYLFAANLRSLDPAVVVHGNNRVLRARLADAEFFWNQDRRQSLASRRPGLDGILFQEGLGSLLAKSDRLEQLAPLLAPRFDADPLLLGHAAALCKCDLLTGLVGEFPELQGIMGGHYARHDGEPDAVAAAIAGHYAPTGREDGIPVDGGAQCLSVADKLDTLVGFFAIGQIPNGDRDPFALRRAALGILRIALEGEIGLDLPAAIGAAIGAYGQIFSAQAETVQDAVFAFLQERLRVLFREEGFAADLVAAVLARQPADPLDARHRLEVLVEFHRGSEAAALAAINKRVHNLLRKEGESTAMNVEPALFQDPAEHLLWEEWQTMAPAVAGLLAERRYAPALDLLAGLRPAVDRFFASVLVMDEDPALRRNRLALLGELQAAFLSIADFSLLQGQ